MKLVCFDSNVLIWGVKEQATLGQEFMIPRTKAFMKYLDENDTRVMIPSVVIAEFLMPIPINMHAMLTNLLDRSFLIASFDTAAASAFAKIWQSKKDQFVIEALAKSGATKSELKMDNLIVATAVSQKADCIYSHDGPLKAFADGYIDVQDIPAIPVQASTFGTDSEGKDWGKLPKKMNEPP